MPGSYSIEELAEETGFDKRVIRSFIEQGLLRGPDSKGRYARYTDSHLIRLKAIKQLRDVRQMTLGEIRIALLAMTEDDIRALSARVEGQHRSKESNAVGKSSVLDYLRSASQSISGEIGRLNTNQMSPTALQNLSTVDRLLTVLQGTIDARRMTPQSKGQRWHRFTVTPDIEISVRGLQDGGQVEQWDSIADCLREILLGGTRND